MYENIRSIDHWSHFIHNNVQFPDGIQELLLTLIGTITKWIKLIPQRHRELLHNKVKRPVGNFTEACPAPFRTQYISVGVNVQDSGTIV